MWQNIKNINSSYAQSESAFQGKKGSPNRPAKLTLKDWRCKIPNGSKVTQIKVHLAHQRIPKKENKYPIVQFDNVENNEIPVITNILGTRERFADAMGIKGENVAEEYAKRIYNNNIKK